MHKVLISTKFEFIISLAFSHRVSLHGPYWPGTCNPPASAPHLRLFFFKVFLFNAMPREAEVCVCECNGRRDWERVTGPPELELQVAMNHPKCYWG